MPTSFPPIEDADTQNNVQSNFDHDKLHTLLTQRSNWMVRYTDSPKVRSLYHDHVKVVFLRGTRKDLVILSHDFATAAATKLMIARI